MKAALGHGSAAHQAGVQAVGLMRNFAHSNSGAGQMPSTRPAVSFMARHGDLMAPVTIAEAPATRVATHIAHFMGL